MAASPAVLSRGRRAPRSGNAAAADDRDFYPAHEEDNVPENPLHDLLAGYLKDALRARFPDKWVTGNICMYWLPGRRRPYAAPDVLVTEGPKPDPLPPSYLRWQDPPPLLVIEIGSKSSFAKDEGPRLATYGWDLRVPEYVYYHPERRELHLYRLKNGGYSEVSPDARGWVHSEALDVWFGVDGAGSLRVYTPEGEALLTHEESEAARRREAEVRAEAEERARREAEAHRREAEARAEAEERARREAEARRELEQRLAELEQRLRRQGGASGSA